MAGEAFPGAMSHEQELHVVAEIGLRIGSSPDVVAAVENLERAIREEAQVEATQ